jgi:probable AcnD-accessory protein PrpF
MTQLKIPAVYMRGGTSKGVFFRAEDLPADPVVRDRILLRVIGSPDPYGKQIDGMGAATSSTSKVVIVGRSERPDSDVDYLFGAVPISSSVIDWSGNCGNLSSAVGPFAISQGLVRAPENGTALIRIWQANIGKRIIAHVPVSDGQVVEEGNFRLDGVTFPAAEIRLEYLEPGGSEDGGEGGALFPTGKVVDLLEVPGVGRFEVTMVNAGNPTIFMDAAGLGLKGSESQEQVNGDAGLLDRCEKIRAAGAVEMGLAATAKEATEKRPHTPKLAFVGPPSDYLASNGRWVKKEEMDLTVRILSMGKLHHAVTGTGAIAAAVAAAVHGTTVNRILGSHNRGLVRLGHPSGSMVAGAEVSERNGDWTVSKAVMSRTARCIMEGWVRIPRNGS